MSKPASPDQSGPGRPGPERIVIDPITRIEGHGKVVIQLDEDRKVSDAKLHVVEFRGYERFVQGHPYWEAPVLLQRICGICFVSHHLAGAKVLDDIVGVGRGLTPAAEKMRRLGHYAQMLQSHATAYFYLVVPEMMFGNDAAPEQRNLLGLLEADPAMVTRVVMLRKWGQELISTIFGKRMHGISAVPGGVQKGLTNAERSRFLNGEEGLLSLDQVMEYAEDGLRLFREFHRTHREEVDTFAPVQALNMSLVGPDGNVDYYDGRIRVVDAHKEVVADFDYHDYLDHFSEAVEEWSYLKFPYLTDLGRQAGSVRVGCLARMNVTRSLSTPKAAEALAEFHDYTDGLPSPMTLHSNWARAIEIIHAAELIRELLLDPDLESDQLVVPHGPEDWVGEGVGVVEAPRGTLLHHYRADRSGAITSANLIVATTQNNEVLNRTVRAVAEEQLTGKLDITEGMLNAVEVGIRAYDPCLSCATHALGQMPLVVTLLAPDGTILAERVRG